jgi:hypothetical protein
MGDAAYYAKIFMEELRKRSTNKDDPIQEWTLDTTRFVKGESQCICTHDIEKNFFIQNKLTGEVCVIGSDCVQRWFEPELRCRDCNQPLGNIMKRIRMEDFYCRSCKTAMTKLLDRYSTWKIYMPGPWKGKTFQVVSDNESWVSDLMRMPTWRGTTPPTFAYKSLHAFKEYARTMFDFN